MATTITDASPTMKAIIQEHYGSTETLELSEISRPRIDENQVLVRVRAAGVDRGVWHLMTGLPFPVRLAGYGLRAPKYPVRGSDFAGQVEAVGSKVTRFRPGDDVMGTSNAAYAEFVAVPEQNLVLKPANVSAEQAAALPISACTALQALRDQGRVQAGQEVLIIGASGGVGTFAVQLAVAFGARVTGVCSSAKVELVRSLGAARVIDYRKQDFADGTRYDLIIDIGGGSSVSHLRRALKPAGTLVIVGDEGGGRWFGMGRQLRAVALSPFVGQRLRMFIAKVNRRDLELLVQLVESGKVTPIVDRAYPLPQVPEAIRDLEAGRARGKLVIAI